MHLEAVNRFREHTAWEHLSEADRGVLQREVAGLPSEIDTDDIESRLFDLTVLSMQLALAEGDMRVFEGHRQRMVEIAMLLEQKNTIPAVRAQLGYLVSIQESGFWEGIPCVAAAHSPVLPSSSVGEESLSPNHPDTSSRF